ncbi:hypothetical protein ACQP00_06275 [Dactylosporangium sp. CS-047395]|uniref:hypothetical protein n=1 Tax=Dactylosporangium sp. CS-047395 TaxID=3239936 RepID=UPI003D8AD5CB
MAIDVAGYGRALLTRVRGRNGREYAEVTLTVALALTEPAARAQLRRLARGLTTVIDRA